MKHKSWLRCVAVGLASAAVGCVATGSRKPEERVPAPQPYRFLPEGERQVSAYAPVQKEHGRVKGTTAEGLAIMPASVPSTGMNGRQLPIANARASVRSAERMRVPGAPRMGRDPDSLPPLKAPSGVDLASHLAPPPGTAGLELSTPVGEGEPSGVTAAGGGDVDVSLHRAARQVTTRPTEPPPSFGLKENRDVLTSRKLGQSDSGTSPTSLATPLPSRRRGSGLPDAVASTANTDASRHLANSPVVQIERTSAEDVPIPTGTLIDLGAALRLAGVENPRINLARERVTEAMAGQLAARALLLPSLTAGASVNLHNGPLLRTSTGSILDVNRQSAYFGAGAFAAGGSTVGIPGVRLFSPLADAIYEPLAARQIVSARRADAVAAENDILLRVVGAYLALVGAETRLEILRTGERDLGEIVRLTEAYARTGQGRVADARRAETNADLLRRQTQDTEGEVLATSARLAELLNLDPSERLRSPDGVIQPVSIIDDGADLETLIQQALANRPEVAARSAEVFESQTRVRQEQLRPLLPTLSVGFSAGGFGGGSPDRPDFYDIYRPRTDFDVVAVWSLQNLGVGTHARVGRNSAVVGQAVANLDLATNRIRQEVTDAVAGIRAATTQIEQARSAVKIATDGLAQEMRRIRQAEGLPLEVLDSFRQLLDSRLELNRAILAYDLAQFRLFVAVGSSPLLRADADPHGEAK